VTAPPAVPPYAYVDTPEGVAALGAAMAGVGIIGLDTESDSMHSYFEKVCLIQVVLPGDRIFIVDSIRVRDLAPLKAPLEDPAVRKVLHGADYDIVCIKRDFGISMGGTFCTMTAGLLLGIPKIGLVDMVESQFGVRLAKAFTRSDWAARPLSAGQLEYLVQDVQYLLPIAAEMDRRLKEAALEEEARLEFERLERRAPASREFDPWGFLRVRGTRALPERGRAVMRTLVELRERRSRELDRPPFKVLANETLVRIAEAKPETLQSLRGVKGVTPYVLRRYGEDVVDAVRRGLADPETVPDRAPPRSDPEPGERRMSFSAQKRHGRLKEWRSQKSAKIGRTTLAILPNSAMFDVSREPPKDLAALALVEGIGAHRAALYGEDILRILQGRRVAGLPSPPDAAPGEAADVAADVAPEAPPEAPPPV
jgi:ribonuclease D